MAHQILERRAAPNGYSGNVIPGHGNLTVNESETGELSFADQMP
jgi:hypothetical protein